MFLVLLSVDNAWLVSGHIILQTDFPMTPNKKVLRLYDTCYQWRSQTKCDGRAQNNPMYAVYTCQVLSHTQFNIIIHCNLKNNFIVTY